MYLQEEKNVIKAVIFDLDGVLVTTDVLHFKAWKELYERVYGVQLEYANS